MGDDRDHILGCVTPDELFGEAVTDPRALRRRYATLAKRHKADPEVSAHVRRLFEAARDGTPTNGPEPASDQRTPEPLELLRQARRDGSAQALFDTIVQHRHDLKKQAPGELAQGLDELLIYAGPALAPGALEALEVVVADPSWEVLPSAVTRWQVQLSHLHSLRAAAVSGELPEALVDGVRRMWAEPGARAAEVWLETAQSLEGTDLDRLFERLEADWPGVLGQIGLAEQRMAALASTAPNPLPDAVLDELRRTYPPSSLCIERWAERVDAQWTSFPVRGGITLCVYVVSIPLLGVFLGVVVGFLARVLATWVITYTIGRTQGPKQYPLLHARSIEPLVEVARDHALLPSEVAAAVNEPVPIDDQFAYAANHPLLRLERLDSGVLRSISPALVERLRRAQQAAVDATP